MQCVYIQNALYVRRVAVGSARDKPPKRSEAIVEGADFVSLRIVWFVLAGFILGFASSTLWEWLYYRHKRQARVEQAAQPLFPSVRADRRAGVHGEGEVKEADEVWAVPYRSPGVYLESEKSALPSPAPVADRAASATDEQSNGRTEPTRVQSADLNAPRLNPATLVTLQTAVAQSSIAHAPHQTRVYPTEKPELPAAANPSTLEQTLTSPENNEERGAVNPQVSPVLPTTTADRRIEPLSSPPVPTEAPTTVVAVQPATASAPNNHPGADYPDNLALIKGVGEAYKRRLYGAGIYTWRQVAESDVELLRRITRAKPNADIAGWRQRARDLAEQHQRWEAIFQGPLDDFTRIEGIGAITADTLYKASLCTYEQLAAALPDELARIVPAPTVGDEIDFDGWINAAARLAHTKQRNQGLLS